VSSNEPCQEYHKSPLAWLREGIDAVMTDNPDLSAAGWQTCRGFNRGDRYLAYRGAGA
jgi:hypothetical protein